MVGRRLLSLVVILLMAASQSAAGASPDAAAAKRLYLLASDAGYPYWSVDRTDPELDSGPVFHTSGPTFGASTERFSQITFPPASLFAAPVQFGPDAPLRFHVALDVTAAGPYSVILALQKEGKEIRSAPATQIAPGVFEGVLTSAGSLGGSSFDMFVVRVTSMSPVHRLELQTGGASWIELAQPAPAWSVPQLLARSPRPDTPRTYASATRTVTLNDDDWQVRTFSGTLDAARTFTFDDPRPAAAVMAWVDLPDTPPLSEPLNGRTPEGRGFTDAPTVQIKLDGGQLDLGQRSATAAAVPGGAFEVKVDRAAYAQGSPYTLHVMSVYGQRSLSQMRWRFPASPAVFTAMGGNCGSMQGVPTTAAVTTFAVDVDAASANPTSRDAWSPAYALPGVGEAPCGEAERGSEVRITATGYDHRWRIGATPARRNIPVVTVADTMLELEIRWAYSPPAS